MNYLAQPTISQHLKELKNAGLIKGNLKVMRFVIVLKKALKPQNLFLNIDLYLENKKINVANFKS
jgi:DNA-binding transcriptional ArsR family regulator